MSMVSKPRVPDGLRNLMKDLTKEILKEKPTDIYDFAENYFHSRISRKENYVVNGFEKFSEEYDFSYIKDLQCYQVPVSLTCSIIPETVTILIKDLIKAVLREQPQNLCDFAVEYFHHIRSCSSMGVKINYSAYENYFINKKRLHFPSSFYIKCTCGKKLGHSYADSLQDKNLDSIHRIRNHESSFHLNNLSNNIDVMNNNGKKVLENGPIYSNNYMNAIYIIQRYFRRCLKKSNVRSNADEFLKTNYEQKNKTIPLQLNQTRNNSKDASNISVAAAALPAIVSVRGTTKSTTSDIIHTNTINENFEVENDEKKCSLELMQSGIGVNTDETTQRETKGGESMYRTGTGENIVSA